MRSRYRDDLPKYSDFFQTVYDEQYNVGALEAHYSILSLPLFIAPEAPIKLQRIAVVWDRDHDDRIIALLEAAFFADLIAPCVLYVLEHKGFVAVIVNEDYDEAERDRKTRIWQKICDNVITDDKFSVKVMLEEEYLLDLKKNLQESFRNYFQYIDDAWTLGPNEYRRRREVSSPSSVLANGVRPGRRSSF